ncbi:unnamed protein product [Echinostoma caproni]|uniref:Peptidase A2 domain-containing protein n=1 Tax=Echinostoma caproni TaxID=27848 RepID=A0A183A881_9TREM|nr:unnamed protein product [Echinostoma caproni]
MPNQSVLFLTLDGRDLYSLLKNLAFSNVPVELPFEQLKSLLLDHILPVNFQATEREKFNSMIRATNIPYHENSSPIYMLQTTERNSQFVFTPLGFESGGEHKSIMDTGSSESIIPKSALTAICPNAVLTPTSERIHGVFGYQFQLLGEMILCAQSESGVLIPIRFLVSAYSPCILGLRAMRLLQGSITLHTNNDKPITSHLQHLIVKCSGNVGGMKVPSEKLELDGEPIFLKRRIPPYGQWEGVLKALQKMERDGVISKVESSAWVTPIVVAMKSEGQLGQAMVEIPDLNDATVHERHVDQIHFK